jgi:hypothetical protein
MADPLTASVFDALRGVHRKPDNVFAHVSPLVASLIERLEACDNVTRTTTDVLFG